MNSIGSITISNNQSLETINAFSSVKTAFGLFSIANNASLKSIDGFKNLTAVLASGFAPYVLINNNPSLTNLDGFSSLEIVTGYGATLEISSNTKLNNINGLSSLTTLAGGGRGTGLFIRDNPALLNIDGLTSFAHLYYGIVGVIDISNNALLENVDGLSNAAVATGDFYLKVTKNPSLKDCDGLFPIMVSFGLEYVSSKNFNIAENGSGCTLEDILANSAPAVVGFSIYDKRTGLKVMDLFNNDATLYMTSPDYPYWILQANTQPGKVGSVVFKVDNTSSRTDNQSPFQYDFLSLAPGTHTVIAEAYSEPNKQGIKGIGRTATLTIYNSAAIISFDVVNTSGKILKTLQEGDKINIKDPAFKSINIRANVSPEVVHHVTFWLNNKHHRTEHVAPYALSGDNNGSYIAWNPRPGSYTLLATPYMKPGTKDFAGQSLEIHFTVEAEPVNSVVSFSIVDTSGKVLRQLNNGDKLNVDDPALKAFSIVANTSGPTGSVKFHLDNRNFRTENVMPYSLAGDQNGYFNPWLPSVGNHSISAIPYLSANSQGGAGKELKIYFTVVKGNINSQNASSSQQVGNLAVSLYPIPVKEDLFLEIKNGAGNIAVVLRNNQGHVVYTGSYSGDQLQPYAMKTSGLPSGIYYLQLRGANGFEKVIRVVK